MPFWLESRDARIALGRTRSSGAIRLKDAAAASVRRARRSMLGQQLRLTIKVPV